MAKIDYNSIKTNLKTILDAYAFTHNPVVGIEGNVLQESYEPYINIELANRDSNSSSQSISANTRTRYYVSLVLTVAVKHMDKSQAAEIRDSILSELELVLMNNRTINGTVITLWLNGGDNISGFVEEFSAYLSAADLRVTLDCLISL